MVQQVVLRSSFHFARLIRASSHDERGFSKRDEVQSPRAIPGLSPVTSCVRNDKEGNDRLSWPRFNTRHLRRKRTYVHTYAQEMWNHARTSRFFIPPSSTLLATILHTATRKLSPTSGMIRVYLGSKALRFINSASSSCSSYSNAREPRLHQGSSERNRVNRV